MHPMIDSVTVPEDERIQFVEDGGNGDMPTIEALIAIRAEAGEEALTEEEYTLLTQYERECAPALSATDHHVNLADHLDGATLGRIARDVLDWVEWDEASRSEWQEIEKRGILALGVSPNSGDDIAFEGGSTVVHPLLGEACVQFASRAMDVLWPPEGPVKTAVLGAISEQRQSQARRVEQFMNYQYTQLMPGAFEHTDKLLLRLPLSGSCFIKAYHDPLNGVMRSLVEPADFIVPYRASDLRTAPRYTERVMMSKNDVRKRQVAGVYRDIDMVAPSEGQRPAQAEEIDAAEGREDAGHVSDDQRRTLFECYCELDIPGMEDVGKDGMPTGIALPYVVTVDKDSQEVLAVYRNWRESDPGKRRIVYHVHYRFMPGLGFYGYGLYHWIGGLARSATGALRALLDSAAFANMQGGYKVGQIAIKDADKPIEPGEFREIATDVDDIRKALLPFNFKEPSQVLFALLGHLEQLGQRFAGTTDSLVGQGAQNTPVGTMLARIEQGSKVFTTIQRRLHQAAAEEYKLVAWLDSVYLPQKYPYAVHGEDRAVMAADFDDRIDVVPVSDPNTVSSIQRFFVSQAVLELASSAPGLYDMRALHKRALQSLRIDGIDELLPKHGGKRLDPVSEGAAVMVGQAIKAFMEQAHDAHVAVHQSQLQGMQPGSPPAAAMMAHIQEHAAMAYLLQMQAQTGVQFVMPGEDDAEELPPEMEAQIATLAAQLAQQAMAAQQEQENQPDPAALAMQAEQERKDAIAQADIARKDEVAKADIERKDAVTHADLTRDDRVAAELMAVRMQQAIQP